MPRIRGYSQRGTRCYGKHDWGSKKITNAIGALIGKVLLTVTLLNCSIDKEIFTCWVKHDLLPKVPKNSVIVMYNASFYKDSNMQKLIAVAGHDLLYLPTYSPDLNPIEHKWAQAKLLRRTTGCSIEDLFQLY